MPLREVDNAFHHLLIDTSFVCRILYAMCFMAVTSSSEATYVSPSFGACKQGGTWHRPGDKPTTLAGFLACRDQCAGLGFSHFGGECPMGGGSNFHCQCANTALGTSETLSSSTCLRNVGHCTGPFTVADTVNGVTYYLGAHGYGSVYLVQEAISPTKFPTKHPTATPTTATPVTPYSISICSSSQSC